MSADPTRPVAAHRDAVAVRVAWPDWDDAPVSFANQFVLQNNGLEVYLSVGQLVPPLIVGNPQEVRARAEELGSVDTHCIARLVMTVEVAQQLHGALSQHLSKIEEQRAGEESTDAED